ncbi:MAG: Rsd/AlgQ family anti-sigma factor [Gammaproteobacteria bacterium]|nr:Rsd/AlgQ family anti-sigma factor [Gammaproteobacteria bacterium]MDJ0870507.1 Rsd/AlgQ family anti-sigma factor [Gammaproteobacteria bacterium]MDJ0893299.1 Rsd/AlgQ family anti-sigma factor [Gammaproteobacteria bacterium]
MSAEQKAPSERRGRTREIINDLVNERQQLLVAFCRVAGLQPHGQDGTLGAHLKEFCQVLVDYAAAVHFELYARVAEGKERRAEVLRIAKESYPRIAEITQRAVDFNDKYDRSEDDPASGALEADLSRLGEELAVRFELEDQLFRALLTRK